MSMNSKRLNTNSYNKIKMMGCRIDKVFVLEIKPCGSGLNTLSLIEVGV